MERLQDTLSSPLNYGVTSEELVTELEQLRPSGAFENVESLYGKYANPNVDVSAEELESYLHEVGTEWEKELAEFFGDDNH